MIIIICVQIKRDFILNNRDEFYAFNKNEYFGLV